MHADRPTPTPSSVTRSGFRLLNKVAEPLIRRGLANPLPLGVGPVVVTTTGRVTGAERRVPLLAARVGSKLFVSTVRGRSLWANNLDADPEAKVWLNGQNRPAVATVSRYGDATVATLRLTAA